MIRYEPLEVPEKQMLELGVRQTRGRECQVRRSRSFALDGQVKLIHVSPEYLGLPERHCSFYFHPKSSLNVHEQKAYIA